MEYRHDNYASEFRTRAGYWWNNAVAFAAGVGEPPFAPYQVEIHPLAQGAPVCLLRCVDCHGQFQRRKGGLSLTTYCELLDDLANMNVQSVVFSGAYSDPTTDEKLLISLLQRSGPRWGVKLHTYGLGLTRGLGRAIVESAAASVNQDSYVTLSKVTTDPRVYQEMCRPSIPAARALEQEEQHLRTFFALAENYQTVLTIRLNCRVTKINGTPSQLAELLRWLASCPAFVHIRFTTDYLPTKAPEVYRERFLRDIYLDAKVASQYVQEAISRSEFQDVGRISFRSIASSPSYLGNRCYNSLLFSAVSTAGDVFPCQGIASSVFGGISYGSLFCDRFPKIWNRYIENWSRQPQLVCPRCVAACDCQINNAVCEDINSLQLQK